MPIASLKPLNSGRHRLDPMPMSLPVQTGDRSQDILQRLQRMEDRLIRMEEQIAHLAGMILELSVPAPALPTFPSR